MICSKIDPVQPAYVQKSHTFWSCDDGETPNRNDVSCSNLKAAEYNFLIEIDGAGCMAGGSAQRALNRHAPHDV